MTSPRSNSAGAAKRKPAKDAAAPPAAVRLEGDYTIYRAAELREELLRELARGARRFDLSGVAEIDSAGLQLLAAVRASVAGGGGVAEFLAPSPGVREVLGLCGLGGWIDGGTAA